MQIRLKNLIAWERGSFYNTVYIANVVGKEWDEKARRSFTHFLL